MSVQRYSIQVPNQVKQESKLEMHLKLRKQAMLRCMCICMHRQVMHTTSNCVKTRSTPSDCPDDFYKVPGGFQKAPG
jgi:hypothetical protein